MSSRSTAINSSTESLPPRVFSFEDPFINNKKLDDRLNHIFRKHQPTQWSVSRDYGQYTIAHAPFDLNEDHLEALRAP
jgi:hypothetical protein